MKFEVGEIVVYVGEDQSWYGLEVQIIATDCNRDSRVGNAAPGTIDLGAPPGYCYCIEGVDGYYWYIRERSLRKRYPPGSDIARDIMANTPKEVEAA